MVAFRASSHAVINSGSNLTLPIPAASQSGDVALLFVDFMNNTSTLGTPSGWTALDEARGEANIASAIYYRVLTASDSGSTVTVTNNSGVIRLVGSLVVYSEVNQSQPIQNHSQLIDNISTASYAVPSLTASRAGYLVEHVAERGNPVGTGFSTTAGLTERLDVRTTMADAVNVAAVTADQPVASPGSYGGHTWQSTEATGHHAAWSIILDDAVSSAEVLAQEDFAGGTNGSDVTTANTSFSSTDFSGASMQFSNTRAAKGSLSALVSVGGVSARASARSNFSGSPTRVSMRWYQYISSIASDTMIALMRDGSNTISAQLRINSSQTVSIYNGSTAVATSTATVPLNSWVRFEWSVNRGANSQELRVFSGTNFQAVSSSSALLAIAGSASTGEANIGSANIGVTASTTNYSSYYDAFQANQGSWVGPDSAVGIEESDPLVQGVQVDGVVRPVVKLAVGVGGGWRPVVKSALGVSGVWRPGSSTMPPVTPPPDPDPDPVSAKMPIYVSPTLDSGSSYYDAFETRFNAGWGTAFYGYWPGDMNWNSHWANFVARHPEGLPTLLSPKGTTASNVQNFFNNMPQAWREKCVIAYYQEPEDNFTTPTARAQFRASVKTMANLVRPYGVMNAVHLQEWAISPLNGNSWGGVANTAELVDADDIDYMSWSLYPAKGNSMSPGIDRIKSFSDTYAPGKPWGITAAGSPVPGSDPIGGTARATRAQIVRDAADYTAQRGGKAFGWFDFDEYNPGRDQLASKDPALREALIYAANVTVPDGLPWS